MNHEFFMQRCIDLAQNGFGNTYPNPMVGSIIVHKNKIIGEGWHQKAGEPHAEVNAIASVQNKALLKESTIYVSLEPCAHFGKTPPCCDLILAHDIPNIVIGTVDPFEKVAGKSIEKLQKSGKNVISGILEKACQNLNKRFFTFHQKKRPYIILKWAESADGFIAPLNKNSQEPVWLTNSYSRQLVHKWRTEEQAILVGTNTVLTDNPKLNVRDWEGKNPIRIIIDRFHKIDSTYFVKDETAPTIVFCESDLDACQNLKYKTIDFSQSLPSQIATHLFEEGIQSVIIEGGANVLSQFIQTDFWDEARVFQSKNNLSSGVKAPTFVKEISNQQLIQDDLLNIYYHD
uniref:bifunctional diaminohydroxyphosphoribosylaminopyrimidine deaminase/5-amino-6-(5-phosphoribosylamino)uracil reductase RibD n=1 Tax=Flavobacterium sp. TaxID=239 RepID=UPI00404B1326